jgi:2-polyprenyl-3-methyl-5-hydroxy-6-metoxy-1,4-benzoquinol methylase
MKMLHRLYDHQQSDSLAATLRSKRLNLLLSLLSTLPTPIKVLDVGGRVAFWQSTGLLDTEFAQVSITLLNTSVEEIRREHPQMKYVVGDARDMSQFRPKEFDFVFSNSVIEHVGSYANQSRMAKEIERVGKRYFVQTPNFYFPIEPHFVFPAFHWLPIAIRVWLITHFNLGWYRKFSDVQSASAEVRAIRLLKKREFARLFPDSELFEERFFGLTKSFVLYSK